MAKQPAYKRGEYKKTDRTCEYCGKSFQGIASARFCNDTTKCRTYFYRQEKRAAKNNEKSDKKD